jgi:hypothetical protein
MIEYLWNIIFFMDEMGWKLKIKSRPFYFFPTNKILSVIIVGKHEA